MPLTGVSSLNSLEQDELLESLLSQLDVQLAPSDRFYARRFSGQEGTRQPLHTVYVPADEFDSDLPSKWGASALSTLSETIRTPERLATIAGAEKSDAERLFVAVQRKLSEEPIEDLRLDFEDGLRKDLSEDTILYQAVERIHAAHARGTLPRTFGIRVKSLEPVTRERAVRTLVRFIEALAFNGDLLPNLRLTLPKVTSAEQVSAMAYLCDQLERVHGMAEQTLKFEIQIETPQSVVSPDGAIATARLIDLAQGRCNGLHFGAYDYTAACGILAKYQGVAHPASEAAKMLMQVTAAGTSVRVSDGATIRMPVGSDNDIIDALRHHSFIVSNALERGLYQGWDMHPAHLITRFATVFAFYLDGFDEAADRIRRYFHTPETSADEPASIRALAAHISRALLCGAVTTHEAMAAGIDVSAIHDLAAL